MPVLTQKSQVTIPKAIRQRIGIGPGDEVEFDLQKSVVILHKKKKIAVIDKYKGFLGHGKTEDVMRELR